MLISFDSWVKTSVIFISIWAHSWSGGGIPCSDACRGRGLDEFLTRLPCGRLLKKATSRAAIAPAAKLGDSQTMFFMDFS
jgi:hypothetical protein